MHFFGVCSAEKFALDPLYHIRTTIDAFYNQSASCLTSCKYVVIDESMNQWLGVGIPNVKKVPRRPHPIGQEFQTLADYRTNCIIRLDNVSYSCPKEYDSDPGMCNLLVAVKPWFSSGRTVITDSWFGSPDMIRMLSELGFYRSCKLQSVDTGLEECLLLIQPPKQKPLVEAITRCIEIVMMERSLSVPFEIRKLRLLCLRVEPREWLLIKVLKGLTVRYL